MSIKKTIQYLPRTLLLLAGQAGVVGAQDVQTFQPPVAETRVNPAYPGLALNDGAEGLVELSMMIDADGKPFEVMVKNSIGGKAFEKEALDAIRQWTFRPAMMNGEAIVGSHRLILRFILEGAKGASAKFVRAYGRFNRELESATQKEVAEQLSKLADAAGYNHYEHAFLNLARYRYALKYGNPLERMTHLDAALAFSTVAEDVTYLPEETARAARRELVNLQVQNQRYAEAMRTWQYFEKTGDTDAINMFQPLAEQIRTLEQDDRSYAIEAVMDDAGSFSLALLKHRIYYTAATGAVMEFKLRCAQNYVGYVVEADVIYDIPAEWGACELEILGDAGATFSLVQQ